MRKQPHAVVLAPCKLHFDFSFIRRERMKYLSAIILILIMVLSFTLSGCSKSDSGNAQPAENQANTATSAQTDKAQQILEANARQPVVVISNPNSMDLTTQPIADSELASEKKMVEELGEMIVDAVAKKGIDYAVEEVNKSRAGAFKAKIFPEKYFYLSFLQKIDGLWTIIAHGTSTDFIGVKIGLDTWADRSGWTYLKATEAKSTASNFIYTNNVYWSDPQWAGGELARFDAYSRFFQVDDNEYWVYFSIWKDK
jgi:uncharacterized protein (UPF0333 family)